MQTISFKIKKVILLLTNGQDLICLTLDAPTTHPELKYDAEAVIKIRYDYGLTYCKDVLDLESVEVINTRLVN